MRASSPAGPRAVAPDTPIEPDVMTSSRPTGSVPTVLRPAGAALALLLAGLAALSSCGPAAPSAEPSAPVLVVGVDGLEWSVLRPLMAEGRLPNLRALCERGSYGKLGTFIPTHSPVVWTSIATGKRMEEHGITSFVDRQGRAFTSSRRRGRALWNVADRHGLSSNVFGWWVTWPVEPVRGLMVSGTSAAAQLDQNWKPALVPGVEDQVHPSELTERVLALAAEAGAAEHVRRIARERVFGEYGQGVLGEAEEALVDQTLWSVQSDATYHHIARTLMPEFPADVTLVYFGGPDVAGHRFWRHWEPELYEYEGSSPEADAALAGVLPRYYEWVDEMIGELVALAGDDADVLVVSDHGMHAVAVEQPNARHITGDHQDGAPGVVIAAGPDIARQGGLAEYLERGVLTSPGSVYGVAPTVLGLLGIPAARDMESRALTKLLTPEARERVAALEPVETHDDGFREPTLVEMSAAGEKEFRQRMAELGYLDLPAPEGSRPVNPATFQADPDATSAGGKPR